MPRLASTALLLPFVLLATSLGAVAQTYTVLNNCPEPINLNIGIALIVVKTGLGPNPGHFWTTTNNGIRDGANVAGAAGFRMNPNEWFYYVLNTLNHNDFNTGISITPSVPALTDRAWSYTRRMASAQLHAVIKEIALGPSTVHVLRPISTIPPFSPSDPARSPPIYQCKTPGVDFLITFCPTGQWPSPPGEVLRNNLKVEKCLDVRGGLLENGTPVQLYDCNDSPAQNWVYHRGTGQVRVKGTNFCLDSGSEIDCKQDAANGSQMKIWQCFDNLPAQTWTLTWDDRLVRAGTGLCLDLTNGSRVNGNIIQTWTCSDFNPNQIWSKWYCLNCD
ncbi:G-X-X-X-Q-X-W domain-containing protein [Coprinopsis sp. MPI-PUGE-AT-0042]|nr:G-X-X-X-Q-X-W domain-containing protein [Coprinopsis sp. MPI-PUGE-AT-0042]